MKVYAKKFASFRVASHQSISFSFFRLFLRSMLKQLKMLCFSVACSLHIHQEKRLVFAEPQLFLTELSVVNNSCVNTPVSLQFIQHQGCVHVKTLGLTFTTVSWGDCFPVPELPPSLSFELSYPVAHRAIFVSHNFLNILLTLMHKSRRLSYVMISHHQPSRLSSHLHMGMNFTLPLLPNQEMSRSSS